MNYKKYNDYELIDKVQENDEDSRNIMFEKYHPILSSLAKEYYHKFSDYGYDLDDFLQEARISFYKALNSYDEKKSSLFYSFMVLCVRRGLLSFCRNISCVKKNISSRYLVHFDECFVEDEKSDISSFFHDLDFQSICKQVILSLPFDVSVVFELKLNGFSYREISVLLDIPTSSVEFRCRKARSELKYQLERNA